MSRKNPDQEGLCFLWHLEGGAHEPEARAGEGRHTRPSLSTHCVPGSVLGKINMVLPRSDYILEGERHNGWSLVWQEGLAAPGLGTQKSHPRGSPIYLRLHRGVGVGLTRGGGSRGRKCREKASSHSRQVQRPRAQLHAQDDNSPREPEAKTQEGWHWLHAARLQAAGQAQNRHLYPLGAKRQDADTLPIFSAVPCTFATRTHWLQLWCRPGSVAGTLDSDSRCAAEWWKLRPQLQELFKISSNICICSGPMHTSSTTLEIPLVYINQSSMLCKIHWGVVCTCLVLLRKPLLNWIN